MEYYIVNREGNYWEYDDLDSIMKFLNYNDNHLRYGNSFNNVRYDKDYWNRYFNNLEQYYYTIEYIIMDKYNRIVPFSEIAEAYVKYKIEEATREKGVPYTMWHEIKLETIFYTWRGIGYTYRYDPVPKVSKNRRQFGHGCRCYNNLQERKRYYDDSKYCKIRKKKGVNNGTINISWLDLPKSRVVNSSKTWKLKKIKKQWMKN